MSAGINPELHQLAYALAELPPHTLWAVGDMEEGPFARLILPQPDGGYTGGYVEATGDTVADAVRTAMARGEQSLTLGAKR